MISLHPHLYYFVKKECYSNWRIDEQRIPFYDLLFITRGGADYIINGEPLSLKEGDILFLTPGTVRSASTGGMSCVSLDFTLENGELLNLPMVTALVDREEFRRLFRELEYEWLQKQSGYELKCQALFSLVLHRLIYENRETPRNAHVESLKRYILEHYAEKLTIRGLAEKMKLHPAYCGSLFRKYEGDSISEFISHVRINKAASLLETGEYTVGEVSEKTGFSDIYYFSNTFKKQTGFSPNYYKKRALLHEGQPR